MISTENSCSEYLQVFDLTLKVLAPLFIGNGKTIMKKFYIYHGGAVSVLDEEAFFSLLYKKQLIDKYEAFMLYPGEDLYTFLTDTCGLRSSDWQAAVRYTVDASASLDERRRPMDIHCFVRNAAGLAFIPGSSVKGALRTVILQDLIRNETSERKLSFPSFREKHGLIPECDYLHTLHLKKDARGYKKEDPVNSVLRGISVSDSMPISNQCMMLAVKNDIGTDGTVGRLNVCRECVQPGTEIRMKLTLDQHILKGSITRTTLLDAIERYFDFYYNTYMMQFDAFDHEYDFSDVNNGIFLGGGVGFFSKSLLYPYLGFKSALQKTAEFLQDDFPKHKHTNDIRLGISPRKLKYTEYNGWYYPFGLCEVDLS